MQPTNPTLCILNNFRRLTRVMSQKMDLALAETGLKSTQFSLLVTLDATGPLPLSQLADTLMMERTTLTRNLKPLVQKGWIDKTSGQDQRIKLIAITHDGKRTVSLAQEAWSRQQTEFIKLIGEDIWQQQFETIATTAERIAD